MHDTTFRTRIFLCFLAVILMTLVLPGLYVRNTIKQDGIRETIDAAQREASLIAMQLQIAPGGLPAIPALLEAAGRKLDIRITYIDKQGNVLAESSSAQLRIGELDNHADRQEIEAAQKHGVGSSIRHSNTLNTDLVYVAVPFAGTDNLAAGFVRVAVPLHRVEERIAVSENHWIAIVGFATLLALGLGYALSAHLERSLREMIRVVESIATGPAGNGSRRRLHILPGKEFRRLAHAVNDMADRIEEHLCTIAEHKAQLKTILDVMNEGVLVIGEKGRIRMINPALIRLFPQARDAEGHLPVEAVPIAELQQALDDITRRDRETVLTLELEPRPDTVLSVQLVRPKDPVHGVLAVAVFHDISDMARLMRVRKEFVANVSHELRTPLTAITGYAETLRDTATDDPAMCARFADTILRNARHMGTMVEDLLRLSRIESGAVPMDMQPVRASTLLADVICACQPQTSARNLNVDVQVSPETIVRGDPHFIAQVFRNLLENACRYAPEHSTITVSDEIHLSAQGKRQALFTVHDEGPGIPETDVARIFERFYRVEKHRSSPASTGLGLAICKHIVERHDGRIWATQGPGGTLRFTLPLLEQAELVASRA